MWAGAGGFGLKNIRGGSSKAALYAGAGKCEHLEISCGEKETAIEVAQTRNRFQRSLELRPHLQTYSAKHRGSRSRGIHVKAIGFRVMCCNFLSAIPGYGFALTVLLAPLLAVYSVDWAQHVVHAVNAQAASARSVHRDGRLGLMIPNINPTLPYTGPF